jgi:hypothetical protein
MTSNSSNFQMNQILYFVAIEDMYPINKQSHTAVGHGGLHKTYKPEYPKRTIDPGQATGKLYHLRRRVECTIFVIYKAGREYTPYW